jgi:hypothetical protein
MKKAVEKRLAKKRITPLEEQILTHVLSASYGSPVPHLFDPPIAGPLLRRIWRRRRQLRKRRR